MAGEYRIKPEELYILSLEKAEAFPQLRMWSSKGFNRLKTYTTIFDSSSQLTDYNTIGQPMGIIGLY